jgi:hypothetical protein
MQGLFKVIWATIVFLNPVTGNSNIIIGSRINGFVLNDLTCLLFVGELILVKIALEVSALFIRRV